MTAQFGMQTVVLSMMSGIAFVCLAFVLYWKLLAEKYVLRKQVPVPVKVSDRSQFERQRLSGQLAGAER